MTYIKVNDVLFPAKIQGHKQDNNWNNRASKTITLSISYNEALSLFVDNLNWSIIYQREGIDGEGNQFPVEEYDNSDYCIAGAITDNRDGTMSVKMGKPTADELLAVLTGEVK